MKKSPKEFSPKNFAAYFLIIAMLLWILIYLGFAYVNLDMNMFAWSFRMRVFFPVTLIIATLLSTLVTFVGLLDCDS